MFGENQKELELLYTSMPKVFLKAFAAGLPVYYTELNTPEGWMIKEYPDGFKELVTFDHHGNELKHP